ncbi:hypothetical protein C9374_010219 [Naegleria lovaniensis]|uniref:Uncharacterized protein n=1 Tax=Naegleria lovaniensis TaxID=51637 RepID=A0AA88GG49_NAELO|nr:uncharacterized protein C9374_010219 [Naegleria lovaniensis]KAG2374845.1 hypothetical protein C9374_010219 [Naegleria lovaniensis]
MSLLDLHSVTIFDNSTQSSLIPFQSLLEDGLDLSFTFRVLQDLKQVYWNIYYVVDLANSKQIVPVGKSNVFDYRASSTEFEQFKYSVDKLPLENIPMILLNNVGSLVASLRNSNDDSELFKCSIVVQSERNERDGKLYRNILNPME